MGRKLQIFMIVAALLALGIPLSAQQPTTQDRTKTHRMQRDSARGTYDNNGMMNQSDTMDKSKHGRHPGDTTRVHKGTKRGTMKHDTTGTHQAPDNTGRNKRDRNEKNVTPMDQSNKSEDLEITRKIRAEIIDQEGMSVNARNIKIVTVDGRVTLRGPVNTEEEKKKIEEIAEKVAQAGNVENQLEVKQ